MIIVTHSEDPVTVTQGTCEAGQLRALVPMPQQGTSLGQKKEREQLGNYSAYAKESTMYLN